MTSTIDVGTVFKTDTRNRVHLPQARKEALLDEFEKSGLSGARFAKLVGVCYSSFAQWARRRRELRTGGEPAICGRRQGAKPVRFLEALIEAGTPHSDTQHHGEGTHSSEGVGAALIVELPGGARMQIHSRQQLQLAADLLKLTAAQQNLR